MIKKVLIANRGEIAIRIIRACKELGIISVAVYSEPDKYAKHVKMADEAYPLGGITSQESYLDQKKIIRAAKDTKSDAIHPGYGFLSERAEFIKRCEKEKINFIGPSAKSVEMMGSKTAARELMSNAGVPIVPGSLQPFNSSYSAKEYSESIGYPVLIKAAAGGGGKGMKKVFLESDFIDAFTSAKSEALKAFGDDSIYIEKLILDPKHIEVQIIADKFGNFVHLFERECSVQRRHQKIVEEAPSSFLDNTTREKITTAAINAAKACNYHNAGTIEFLVDVNKEVYFLEMNTRVQVEHPVTEMITGIDIVKEQIKIASGDKLSFSQDELKINGHSIECRIYAEDPDNNFMPSTGKIVYYSQPSGPGIRIDEGIEEGSEVTMYFDPLLCKLTVHSSDRATAIRLMKEALKNYKIAGIKTNITLLLWILKNNSFVSGKYSINLIDKEFIHLLPDKWKEELTQDLVNVACISAAVCRQNKSLGQNSINEKNDNYWRILKYE